MKLAVDSSAMAKRYIKESGSDSVDRLLYNASALALCVILVPEILSGLNRRLREGALPMTDYREAKRQLLDDVHDATLLQVTPSVISRSVRLLEKNVLRAMVALHIACAAEWQADLFVTADRRQSVAATNAGLQVEYIAGDDDSADG